MTTKIYVFVIFGLIACGLNAQVVTEKRVTWDYPVKPGTEEWKQLEGYKAKVDVCQIPERLLTSLSTEELTDICLKYPLLGDIYSFNTLDESMEHLYRNFNGIRELFGRKDAPGELLKRYNLKQKDFPLLDGPLTLLEKGDIIFSASALEILLCHAVRHSGDKAVSREILQGLVNGYEEKIKYADYFRGPGFRSNFYARIHAISILDGDSFGQLSQDGKRELLSSGWVNDASIEWIDNLSRQLVKQTEL
jgi:hypothetical protein